MIRYADEEAEAAGVAAAIPTLAAPGVPPGGIAGLALSGNKATGPAEMLARDNPRYREDVSLEGRLAFYTNGKFENGWSLTASADAGKRIIGGGGPSDTAGPRGGLPPRGRRACGCSDGRTEPVGGREQDRRIGVRLPRAGLQLAGEEGIEVLVGQRVGLHGLGHVHLVIAHHGADQPVLPRREGPAGGPIDQPRQRTMGQQVLQQYVESHRASIRGQE